MDLYSFADGDPLNNFDPDGRLFAGTLNGAGQWGSQMYAGLGNTLDAALFAIVSPWNPLTATRNFSGGYEADFRYQRNFDQGSAAFQLGHQLGYAGAEIGFQMGMFAGPMAFGRMASTAASGRSMSAAIARSGGAMSYGITRAAPSTPIVSLQAPVMTGNTLSGPTKLPATTTTSSVGRGTYNVGGMTHLGQPAGNGPGAMWRGENISSNRRYRGGPHSSTKLPVGDGLESHHMPDRRANPSVDPEAGPAIQMDVGDHRWTSSNGKRGQASQIYRDQTAAMIAQGRYRDAMAREIWDVRRAARIGSGDRTKYNKAIQEMLDYAKRSGQLPVNPKR
jgi:hypothetical protein